MELVPPPKPPASIRKAALARRRSIVTEGILRGRTHGDLAKELGVSVGAVKADVKWATSMWMAASVKSRGRKLAILLQKNQMLQRAAWEGWERSRQERKMVRQESSRAAKAADPTPLKVVVEKEERDGGVHWIAILERLQAREAELLGLIEGAKTVLNDNSTTNIDNRKVIMIAADDSDDSDMPWMRTIRAGTAEQGQPFVPETVDAKLLTEATDAPPQG